KKNLEDEKAKLESRQEEVRKLIKSDVFTDSACWKYAEAQSKKLGISQNINNLAELEAVDKKAKESVKPDARATRLTRLKSAETILEELRKNYPQLKYFLQFIK